MHGDIAKSTAFLRSELPVRVANILQEIHLLPKKLLTTPSATLVTSWYEESFSELADYENIELTPKHCDEYLKFLEHMHRRHENVVETMAFGVMEMREAHGTDSALENQMQYFLDRLYTMRISIRMLVSQHLLVFGLDSNQPKRFVGCIDQHCDVVEILEDAYSDAKMLCDHYYADCPEMKINLANAVNGSIKFVYVPSHLYHILFELLKVRNAGDLLRVYMPLLIPPLVYTILFLACLHVNACHNVYWNCIHQSRYGT
ncbi:unnamed protein product [Schistocephalus solidus]|uniref:Protein-serine/threonine kinase n=1 Tax=Schistocephalus solidus TaxID=70667 RepID=A0A183T456_SCHSO|nr:unnamed protein product [Schistocephalus solidus]